MAFNIMDLFGPAAVNRLLQPIQDTSGVQNMLLSRPSPQNYPISAAAPPMPPQLDAQTTAAVAPQAIAAPAPMAPAQIAPEMQQQPGFRDRIASFGDSDRGQYLNDLFTGWAAGSTPSESLAYGAKLTSANSKDRQAKNETVDWLKSKGVAEDEARRIASSPPALNEYLKNIYQQNDPARQLELQKTQLEIENLRNPTAKLTDDQREYQAAKDQGFDGTFMDFMVKMKEAGRQQVNIDTGVKLPSGYQWVDPNDQSKGVQPIAGGPATQIPGELAARIGMGENFLKNDLPVLREEVKAGTATGPLDRLAAWGGYGKPAQVQRKFQSGVEVLSRLLSGAGMTQVEIDEKTARYMPTMADGPESLATKLDQLEAEIKAASEAALRGRGGNAPAAAAQEDPLGIR